MKKKKNRISHQGKLIDVKPRLLDLSAGSKRQDGRLCALGEQHRASWKEKTWWVSTATSSATLSQSEL